MAGSSPALASSADAECEAGTSDGGCPMSAEAAAAGSSQGSGCGDGDVRRPAETGERSGGTCASLREVRTAPCGAPSNLGGDAPGGSASPGGSVALEASVEFATVAPGAGGSSFGPSNEADSESEEGGAGLTFDRRDLSWAVMRVSVTRHDLTEPYVQCFARFRGGGTGPLSRGARPPRLCSAGKIHPTSNILND